MDQPPRQMDVEVQGDVFCIRLRQRNLDETALEELSQEFLDMVEKQGARKVVLILGPQEPLCLYSVFLAKLVSWRRFLHEVNGSLCLAQVSTNLFNIFQACGLAKFFDFQPDLPAAIACLQPPK